MYKRCALFAWIFSSCTVNTDPLGPNNQFIINSDQLSAQSQSASINIIGTANIETSVTTNALGVGTEKPLAALDVLGTADTSDAYVLRSQRSDGSAKTRIRATAGGTISFETGEGLRDNFASLNPRMTISRDGSIGIGTATPVKALDVVGEIRATGGISSNMLCCSSSRDYKTDIVHTPVIENAKMLEAVRNLQIARFRFKKGDNRRRIGFIAEEMPPEVLSADGKAVDVYSLLTYTIGALKAQQEEIRQLKSAIARRR